MVNESMVNESMGIEPLDVNEKTSDKYTPLFLACYRGYKTLDHDNEEEVTKVKQNRFKIVKLLLTLGAKVNFKTEKVGMTALHWAAYHEDVAVVRLLL